MNLTCKIFYLSLSILLLYVSSMLLIYLATAVKCDQSLQQLICGLFFFFCLRPVGPADGGGVGGSEAEDLRSPSG